MGNANIKERLDRVVANELWRTMCPKATVKYLPMIASDHAPLIINSHKEDSSGPKPFCFEEAWIRDSSSSRVIKEAWGMIHRGNPQFCLSEKIKNVKVKLKWWIKNVFGLIQKRISWLISEIEEVQRLEPNEENISLEQRLQWEYHESLRRGEALWRQKLRISWLTTVDLNIRFFHVTTTIRRRRNQICFLKNETSRWVQGDEAIGNCFVSSFLTLFQSSNSPFPDELCNLLEPVISDDDNSYLCSVPYDEEIKETLFSMSSNKSPGPDGFSPLFFKHYWRFVNKEVVEAVKNFFLE